MDNRRFFNIGLPQLPINVDPKIEPDLRDVYNAIRNLVYLIGQYGGYEAMDEGRNNAANVEISAGAYKRRLYAEALEAMTYGSLVNLVDSGGVIHARLADASPAFQRPCYGINNTVGTCAIGDTIEIALPGCYVTSIGGLVPGTRYFLTAGAGLMSSAAPAAAGSVRQAVGFALDTTVFYFFPDIGWWII